MINGFFDYSIYIFFGLLPSLVWLFFYLRKDVHPEPKRMILKIFFYGMLSTIPAIFLETGLVRLFGKLNLSVLIIFILNVFVGIALTEELLKFLVVKFRVLHNPEYNEPVDAMIYMIIAALGFAAGENLLILFPFRFGFLGEILGISLLRFIGATFLHALSSGILGFFIGLSYFKKNKQSKLIIIGLLSAVFVHGLYNFFIINPSLIHQLFKITINTEGIFLFVVPLFILIISAIFVSLGFKKLKKLSGG